MTAFVKRARSKSCIHSLNSRFERNGFDPDRKNPSPKDPELLDMVSIAERIKISGAHSRTSAARSRDFHYFRNNYANVNFRTGQKKTPKKLVKGPVCYRCGESHAEMGSHPDRTTPRDRCQRCIRNFLVYGYEWPIRKSPLLKLNTPIVPLYVVHV